MDADIRMYYAMASLAPENAWALGLAQNFDTFGPRFPEAPPSTVKQDAVALDVREPRAFAVNGATNTASIPGSPLLESQAATSENVTDSITVTQECPGTSGFANSNITDTDSISESSVSSRYTGTGSTYAGVTRQALQVQVQSPLARLPLGPLALLKFSRIYGYWLYWYGSSSGYVND